MTLNEFISQDKIQNIYIYFDKFNKVQIKKTKHILKIIIFDKINITGDFKLLINHLDTKYPECVIYIENVSDQHFHNYLLENDFKFIGNSYFIYNKERLF